MSDEIKRLQQRVRMTIDHDAPLPIVEREVIDDAPLDGEDRDALWLYAWAYEDSARRRRQHSGRVRRIRRLERVR
jgi:hypothetical protein